MKHAVLACGAPSTSEQVLGCQLKMARLVFTSRANVNACSEVHTNSSQSWYPLLLPASLRQYFQVEHIFFLRGLVNLWVVHIRYGRQQPRPPYHITGHIETQMLHFASFPLPLLPQRSTTVCFLRVDAGSVTMRDYFPGMTVLTLKSMIRARFGHPIKEQRLICAGQSLEDDRTLFSYRVEDMSTVILTGRLRGGKPVILLYPPNELEVSVRVGLSSDWSFSVLYPKPSDEVLLQSEDSPVWFSALSVARMPRKE